MQRKIDSVQMAEWQLISCFSEAFWTQSDGARAHYSVVVQLVLEELKRKHRAAASLFPFSVSDPQEDAYRKSIKEF